jgi:hypothetical protein
MGIVGFAMTKRASTRSQALPLAIVWLSAVVTTGQTPHDSAVPPMAEQVFKNVR